MTPDPRHYRSITAYRLAQAEHAEAKAFARKLRRFLLAAFGTVILILALINWPLPTMAAAFIGAITIAILAGRQLRYESKTYNEEHDLP